MLLLLSLTVFVASLNDWFPDCTILSSFIEFVLEEVDLVAVSFLRLPHILELVLSLVKDKSVLLEFVLSL